MSSPGGPSAPDAPPPPPNPTVVDVGNTVADTSAPLKSISLARVWIYSWTFLTWLFTFAFFVLLVVVFRTSVQDNAAGRSYTRSNTIVRGLGCLNKNQWSNWTALKDAYTTNVPATPTINQAGSNAIRDAAMRAMRCHGNMQDQPMGALSGGLTASSTQLDALVSTSFDFASPACACVHALHAAVYYPAYLNATTRDSVVALGEEFYSTGAGRTIVRECLFSSRSASEVEVVDWCFLSVSPYMVVLYTNTVAGIFGALYLMTPDFKGEAMLYKVLSSPIAVVSFVAINIVLGITGVVVSGSSISAIVFVSLAEVVPLFYVVSMVWFLRSQDANVDAKSTGQKSSIRENFRVVQRMSFWAQYIITLPGIILLYDATQQQRVYTYLWGRGLMGLSIGFLAAGGDMVSLFYSKVVEGGRDKDGERSGGVSSESEDNLRSAAWWSWYSWVAAVSMLVYTSPPLSLSWTVSSLVPGAHTLIPVGFALYVVGMPLVCMPNLARDNTKGHPLASQEDSTALGLRLVVDILARTAITMTVYFWLALERQ